MVQTEITEQIDIRDLLLSVLQVVFEMEINPCICVQGETITLVNDNVSFFAGKRLQNF